MIPCFNSALTFIVYGKNIVLEMGLCYLLYVDTFGNFKNYINFVSIAWRHMQLSSVFMLLKRKSTEKAKMSQLILL